MSARSLLPLLPATLPVLVCLAAFGGCEAAPAIPPPVGTLGDSGGSTDISLEGFNPGACPGTGTVVVSFARGSAKQSCWSAFATSGTSPTVTLGGNAQSFPGMTVAIALKTFSSKGQACDLSEGSHVPLDSDCVFVAAFYGDKGKTPEWQAYAGGAEKSPFAADAGAPAAKGSIIVGAIGTALGQPVSVTFEPGATLVVDAPGFPEAAVSGSITATIE